MHLLAIAVWALLASPCAGAEPAGKGERFGVTREDVTPQTNDFVQLYLGTLPLSPKPARVSTDGTATLESVTLSAQTTTGTIITLEKVREDGQFFFPHEVVRRYTIRLSATAARQLILGDQGELFVNPDGLGSEQKVLVLLGNRLVPELGPTHPENGCAMGRGAAGPPLADGLVLLSVIAWIGIFRRRVVTCASPEPGEAETSRNPGHPACGG